MPVGGFILALALLGAPVARAEDGPGAPELVEQAADAIVAKKYADARKLLDAAYVAAPNAPGPIPAQVLAQIFFYRGVCEWYGAPPKKRADNTFEWWRKARALWPEYVPDARVLPESEAQDVYYALASEFAARAQVELGLPEDPGDAVIFVSGRRMEATDSVYVGTHFIQIRCDDGMMHATWYEFGTPPPDYLALCRGESYPGAGGATSKASPKDAEKQAKEDAKRAEKERLEAERLAKVEAEKQAKAKAEADRLAALKAEADRQAALKAEAARIEAERQAAMVKAEADRKAAAAKAEADRQAALKAEAERQAALKAEADRKAAAAKAEADRQAALKAEADRQAALKAEADRQAALKAEADRQAVAKAEADRQAAAKAEADREAAAKAEADREVATAKAEADRQAAAKAKADADREALAAAKKRGDVVLPEDAARTGAGKGARIGLYAAGGGLVLGGVAVNFLVVEPAWDDAQRANAQPGSITREEALSLANRYDTGRYAALGMLAGGLLTVGTGVGLGYLDATFIVSPNQLGITGRW
ncbi:MAG: hypothetical protein RLZZ299_1125 [Pseudomonadota bacterium]